MSVEWTLSHNPRGGISVDREIIYLEDGIVIKQNQ